MVDQVDASFYGFSLNALKTLLNFFRFVTVFKTRKMMFWSDWKAMELIEQLSNGDTKTEKTTKNQIKHCAA